MTDDESLEQPHNDRIVQTRTVYAVSDSSAGEPNEPDKVSASLAELPRAAGPDTPSFRPPVTDGPGMMADAQPAPYWQPRHDKCQSGCDVHCRGGSPCSFSTGCALLKDAQPTHKRVFDYDGSFRCLDCGAQWGALPGNPVEPTECVILSAQPTPVYRCEQCGGYFTEPMPEGHMVVRQNARTGEPYPDQCGPVTLDTQPTPRTDLFFSTLLLHMNPSAVPEDEEPLHLFCGGLEAALAQKEAELRAAEKKHQAEMVRLDKAYAQTLDETVSKLDAERTAREQDNNWSANENSQLGEELANAKQRLAAVEARLDAVMLEYCPDEMTPEQIANWAVQQRQATAEEAAEIEAALTGKKKEGGS